MRKVFVFVLLFICTQTIAQNVKSVGIIDIVYNSDSLEFDSKQFGFGRSISGNNLTLHAVDYIYDNERTGLFNFSFSRYFIPVDNNKHNFLLMSSFSFGIGKKKYSDQNENKELEMFSFKRESGMGYKFSDFTIIPYTASGVSSYAFDSGTYRGGIREFGVNFKFRNCIGFSLTRSTTIYGYDANLLEVIGSRVIEGVGNGALGYALSELLPNNELYPIYFWVTNIAYQLLHTSINRSNYNIPFNHTKEFEVSSYNLNMKFELSLFQ